MTEHSSLRVLHVVDVLTLGGAQALGLRVIAGLKPHGVENALCVALAENRTHPLWELPVNPTYLEFHGDYRRPLAWSRCVRQLQKVIQDFQPDVVHTVNWLADVTAARACRATGVPHVAYLVDRRNWLASPAWQHTWRRRLTRRAFAGAQTQFMAVSNAVAEFIAKHLPIDRERIDVVRNSIDVNQFSSVASARRTRQPPAVATVGTLSRLEQEKGLLPFLNGVQELLSHDVRLRVLIAGEGPLREALEQRVKEPQFKNCVSVVGEVTSSRDFYGQCDIFVVPSIHSEGLPTTILEAMASGCAILATDVGGATEVIDSGEDGLIVPAESPSAIARGLDRMINDIAFRDRIQNNACRRAVRDFGIEQMIEQVADVLTRAAAGRSTREIQTQAVIHS